MTCSALRDQILGHGDNVAPSDADNTDRSARILEAIVAIVADFALSRKWRFRQRVSAALTFSSGSVSVPSDFSELGPQGGLYNSATGEKLEEVDATNIHRARQALSTDTDRFSIFGRDNSTGYQKLQIPSTGSFSGILYYLAGIPTLDFSSNNDNLKLAVPEPYHQLALVPGVLWKMQRGKGDARSDEYFSEYQAAKRLAASSEKQRRSEAVRLPTFSGR